MGTIYPSRTDLVTAMRNPQVSYKVDELVGGSVIQKGSRIIQYSGGYTTVFPFHTKDSKKVAVRCWIADIGDAKKRSLEISSFLSSLKSPYFCEFQYLDNALLINGSACPIVMMDWVDGKTLKTFINENIYSNPKLISKVRENFKEMVGYFHNKNIAHGDLQHGNILVNPDASLTIIDYDSMYIKPLEGMTDAIKGLSGYQHPSRQGNQFINSKLDYFSELVIYLSLLVFEDKPALWQNYHETEDLLFSKEDFSDSNSSSLINGLLNSTHSEIAELTVKLVEELKKTDFLKLRPLEDLLMNKLQVAKEGIFDKWTKQQNSQATRKTELPNTKMIIDKF
ncbi:protein kinase domain-containing protein [Dyadobacter chenhuakuii]|uniref:AarF/UbiB family protein n=1 Tax=Dyadobacter chenhuakuii TaxID=2909339 RepID=A0ABY4XLS3_9BACT|nr:AarF/UbiB family protein [Dyadobacter chenhuakuii]MCF2494269.1 AarF/UbiB family protein [Dyadobacter chenhuakuii]USJ31394.1 AarF/UbiB family protein [Dyadobacter chenhuakuii]